MLARAADEEGGGPLWEQTMARGAAGEGHGTLWE